MKRKCLIRQWIPAQYLQDKNGFNYGPVIEGTNCYTEFNISGLFHGWGLDVAENEQNLASYSVALVEIEDGTISKVYPENIRFTEP